MELSKEHLIKLINELDINKKYDYVRVGDSKVVITNIDIENKKVIVKNSFFYE